MGSSATVLNVASIVADETTMYGGGIGKPAFSSFTLALTERKLSTTGPQSAARRHSRPVRPGLLPEYQPFYVRCGHSPLAWQQARVHAVRFGIVDVVVRLRRRRSRRDEQGEAGGPDHPHVNRIRHQPQAFRLKVAATPSNIRRDAEPRTARG